MSRLYTVVSTAPEIAAHFGAEASPELIVPAETVEALPGLVVFEKNGRRLMRQMAWGFPRLTREMRERGDLPGRIGLVADLTKQSSFSRQRRSRSPFTQIPHDTVLCRQRHRIETMFGGFKDCDASTPATIAAHTPSSRPSPPPSSCGSRNESSCNLWLLHRAG